jgi:hypothetical protein
MHVCSNKGTGPLQRGDNHKNVKMRFIWVLPDIVQNQFYLIYGPRELYISIQGVKTILNLRCHPFSSAPIYTLETNKSVHLRGNNHCSGDFPKRHLYLSPIETCSIKRKHTYTISSIYEYIYKKTYWRQRQIQPQNVVSTKDFFTFITRTS